MVKTRWSWVEVDTKSNMIWRSLECHSWGQLGTWSSSFSLHCWFTLFFWKINLQHHQKNMPNCKRFVCFWDTFPSKSSRHPRWPDPKKTRPNGQLDVKTANSTSSDSCFVGCVGVAFAGSCLYQLWGALWETPMQHWWWDLNSCLPWKRKWREFDIRELWENE